MGQNNQLLQQYKKQREILVKYIADNGKQIRELNFDNFASDNKAYHDSEYYSEIYYAEQRLSNLNWMLNNLNYTILWLENGHEPGKYNGIENRYKAGEDSD